MKKLLSLGFLFTTVTIYAQYPLAPEVWSIPKKVTAISQWQNRSESPSISFDKQKLYFDGIAVTEWADTGWGEPAFLPNYINQNLARWPIISPNGKRIFYTWFVGGWDLYYSDWDSTINNWGQPVNCGPNVNTVDYAENTGSLPNDTTLIFLSLNEAHISHWDSGTETWGPSERWPTPTLWFTSDYGFYLSPSFKKVYYVRSHLDTTIDGGSYLNYDIVVRYADSTNPTGYTIPHTLNYCLYADTQYFEGNYIGRFEGFPTLTPDGKKMYFTADYDSQETIYESIMLIDENGNPVSVNENYDHGRIPDKMELDPAYPNPFNPTTVIGYRLSEAGNVKITIYDVLGKEVSELVDEEKSSGEYKIIVDAEKLKLSSGTYIVVLKTKDQQLSQKIIYIK